MRSRRERTHGRLANSRRIARGRLHCADSVEKIHDANDVGKRRPRRMFVEYFSGSDAYADVESRQDLSAGLTVVMAGTRRVREAETVCLQCDTYGRTGHGRTG